jgi:methyl-accepting chemotaxis protein
MNDYVFYILHLAACTPVYFLYTHLTGKGSIVKKIAWIFYPALFLMAFTAFSFGISRDYWLWIPGFGVVLISFWLLSRMVRKPITDIESSIKNVANGHLNVESLVHIKDNKDEFGKIAKNLQDMTSMLAQMVASIKEVSANVVQHSDQLTKNAETLSNGAASQASAAEEVASAIEEMLISIQQSSKNAMQAEKISVEASKGIQSSIASSVKTTESMQAISEKINIINEISDETNILSLNAAVEAARAGEHGKGFGIVAAEVKKLAHSSKQAADEIISLSHSARLVSEQSKELLSSVAPDVETTATLVNEINTGAREQNQGVEQIDQSVQELNAITQENASSSEEMANSAVHLAELAKELNKLIGYFK